MARSSASLNLAGADIQPQAAVPAQSSTAKASNVRWRIFAIIFALTMVNLIAVSYTHLTLPTILLV